jgi:anti-sigma regulatory factor (Ser/Thr protein kinase)
VYGSDDELLAIAVPFLRGGLAAGEPTLVSLDQREERLVLDALGGDERLTLLPGSRLGGGPFTTLDQHRRRLTGLLDGGAPRVRLFGQVPHDDLGPTAWDGWARYEAALNHVCAPLEVWAVCPYDGRLVDGAVLEDVVCTHPRLATAGGPDRGPGAAHTSEVNDNYAEPAAFLAARARSSLDPLEDGVPDVTHGDPTPVDARRAIGALAEGLPLGADAADRLVLAVSELVTNAVVHGRPPVDLRAWAGEGRIVVTVRDAGTGPDDPFVGLLPQQDTAVGGLGLWMVNQSCARVALVRDDDGFVVRVVAEADGSSRGPRSTAGPGPRSAPGAGPVPGAG